MSTNQQLPFNIDDFIQYFKDEEIAHSKGFDSAGWNAATKAEKLIWGVYELADKFGILPGGMHGSNKGAANALRKDITYGHHVTELLGATSRKFSEGIRSDSQEEIDAEIASTVLDVFRVIPRLSVGLFNKLSEKNTSKIKDFHKSINSFDTSWEYQNDTQRQKIHDETDFSKILKLHKDFLNHNLQIKQQIVKVHESEITIKIRELEKDLENAHLRIKKLNSVDSPNSDLIQKEVIRINHVEKSMVKIAATPDTPSVAEARASLVQIDEQMKVSNTLDVSYSKYGKAADGAAAGLAFGSYIASMTKIDSESSAMSIASQSSSLVYELSSILSAGLDVKDAAKFGKASKALGAFGAVAGTAASSLGIADYAKALDDPNLPSWQRDYIKAELGLQSVTMTLSAIEGSLSVAQAAVSAGSKAASFLGKAVPIIGAVASIAGAINPAKWAEFKQKENRISQLEESDEYSSDLLADLLDDSLDAEKGFYAASTIIDAVTGIAGAGLAASGVGAGVGIAVGLIGGAISAIIQACQQTALEAIADRYERKMRTDDNGIKQSIEEYFEGSFDQKQDKIREKYEEFFDGLIGDSYDSIFTFGSQTLTGSDLSLAAITKTGGELGKTAKHYFEEYSGQERWDRETIKLEVVQGADKVYLPDNGDGSARYLTFMSPLMASGQEQLTRRAEGKNKYYTTLEIKDLAGWEVIDQGKSNTVFSTGNIVTSAQYASGKTLLINFAVNAGQGNDTYMAGAISTKFNGGEGEDIASYTDLEKSDLSTGLTISGNGDEISVNKHFDKGTKYIRETIEQYQENYGKRREIIEYRNLSIAERGNKIDITDNLKGIEILQTTDLADNINLSGVNVLEKLYTFDGDDNIITGDYLSLVASGNGDDMIKVGKNIQSVFAEDGNDYIDLRALKVEDIQSQQSGDQGKIIYIDGGSDQDTVKFSDNVFSVMKDEYRSAKETDLMAEQLAHSVTMGEDSGQVATMFKNMMGEQSSLNGIYLKDMDWFDYDLSDQTLQPYAEWDGVLFDASVSTYKNAWRTNESQLKTWADTHDASSEVAMDSSLIGGLEQGELRHFSGKLYLEAGKTYEFKEYVDDHASLYLNGEKLFGDNIWYSHKSKQYTPEESGFVQLDFYANNYGGPGNFRLDYKITGESVFRTLTATSQSADDSLGLFQYKTAALAGFSTGNEALDHTYYLSEYRDIVNHAFAQEEEFQSDTLYAATIETHNVHLGHHNQLKAYADLNTAGSRTEFDGNVHGQLPQYQLVHVNGKVYLEAGKTYEFKESVDDYASLYINGQNLLGDNSWYSHTSKQYTPSKSGFVQLDFYAYNHGGPGNYDLSCRIVGESDKFQTITGSSYEPALRGLINVHEDTYSDVSYRTHANDLESWVNNRDSNSFTELGNDEEIQGSIAQRTIKHVSGEIYLHAGEMYLFREAVDDYAFLKINGDIIFSDTRWNSSAQGSYTVSESGYYQLDFYAYNNGGPGNMKLEYKLKGLGDFTTIQVSDNIKTPSEINLDFSAASIKQSVNIIGDENDEKIKGSNYADFLFGHTGRDALVGNAGNDVLAGGGDADMFVFDRLSDHDLIMESFDEDFEHNTIKLSDHNLSDLKIVTKGDDLIITASASNNWSITLADYFEGDKGTQRLIDKNDNEMFLNQSGNFQGYYNLSYGLRSSYETAMSDELIQQMRQIFSQENIGTSEYA